MNDRNSHMTDLEQSLRALAEEDCHLQAPPHVHAAVMRAWDVSRPLDQHRCRWRSRVAALYAIGSIAAAVLVVVFMYRAPSQPSRPLPIAARAAETPTVVGSVPRVDGETPAETHGGGHHDHVGETRRRRAMTPVWCSSRIRSSTQAP
jgi:hypothetical protein